MIPDFEMRDLQLEEPMPFVNYGSLIKSKASARVLLTLISDQLSQQDHKYVAKLIDIKPSEQQQPEQYKIEELEEEIDKIDQKIEGLQSQWNDQRIQQVSKQKQLELMKRAMMQQKTVQEEQCSLQRTIRQFLNRSFQNNCFVSPRKTIEQSIQLYRRKVEFCRNQVKQKQTLLQQINNELINLQQQIRLIKAVQSESLLHTQQKANLVIASSSSHYKCYIEQPEYVKHVQISRAKVSFKQGGVCFMLGVLIAAVIHLFLQN